LHTALVRPGALVLLLSPSLRQSGELFRKVVAQYRALGKPVATARETALTLELANGSRVISLPGTEATIRGFSGATLLVIDEASRVPDGLYRSVRPMLAVSRGRLVALSTPFVRAGWFYSAWTGDEPWDRVSVKADQCPRIAPEFLAEERAAMGPRWYRMEYECSFEDAVGSVFDAESVRAAACDDLPPLRLGGEWMNSVSNASDASGCFLVGLDLGRSMDPTALAVVERTGEYPTWQHGVRLLRRWPLGAKYPEIVRDVGAMVGSPPLKGCRLVVDYSGVGRPVVDQLAHATQH
jgi:hypothetical protein